MLKVCNLSLLYEYRIKTNFSKQIKLLKAFVGRRPTDYSFYYRL